MLDVKNTYWNHEGELQGYYDFLSSEQDNGKFEFTKTSKNIFTRYYRFYNDSDNYTKYSDEEYAVILEEKVSDRIAKEYMRYHKIYSRGVA